MNKKSLSIVIAVYNEKDSLLKVLEKIEKVNIGMDKQIIIVDGCSIDGTREILRQINDPHIKVIFEQERKGKGAALREGFANAEGEIILIQDADLEINPFEYPALLKPILEQKSEIVYGSRFMQGRGKTNIISYLGNRLMTTAVNILFNVHLNDIETCYKVFKKDAIADFRFLCNGFDFDAELTALFLKKGKRISEIPISYSPRDKKEGEKLHWITGLTSLISIIRCRFSRSE